MAPAMENDLHEANVTRYPGMPYDVTYALNNVKCASWLTYDTMHHTWQQIAE